MFEGENYISNDSQIPNQLTLFDLWWNNRDSKSEIHDSHQVLKSCWHPLWKMQRNSSKLFSRVHGMKANEWTHIRDCEP